MLKRVGLTSVRVGIEFSPVDEERQRDFIALCRGMGIRTVAGFLLGFPEDSETSIRGLLDYAIQLNPTRAEFQILTPYPGTRRSCGAALSAARAGGAPAPEESSGEVLTPERLQSLQGECFERFYCRWRYLRANAHLLWPGLALGDRPRTGGHGRRKGGPRRPAASLERSGPAPPAPPPVADRRPAHAPLACSLCFSMTSPLIASRGEVGWVECSEPHQNAARRRAVLQQAGLLRGIRPKNWAHPGIPGKIPWTLLREPAGGSVSRSSRKNQRWRGSLHSTRPTLRRQVRTAPSPAAIPSAGRASSGPRRRRAR